MICHDGIERPIEDVVKDADGNQYAKRGVFRTPIAMEHFIRGSKVGCQVAGTTIANKGGFYLNALSKYSILIPIKRRYEYNGDIFEDIWEEGKPTKRIVKMGEWFRSVDFDGVLQRTIASKDVRQIVVKVEIEEEKVDQTDVEREAVEEALRQAREKAKSGGEFSALCIDCVLCVAFGRECSICPVEPVCQHGYRTAAGDRKTAYLYEGMALLEGWLADHQKPVKRDVTEECELIVGSISGAVAYKHGNNCVAFVSPEGWKFDYSYCKNYSIKVEGDCYSQTIRIFKKG